jgi:hypothetical protein
LKVDGPWGTVWTFEPDAMLKALEWGIILIVFDPGPRNLNEAGLSFGFREEDSRECLATRFLDGFAILFV